MLASLSSSSSKQDIEIEDDIKRNPYNIRGWLNYLTYKSDANAIDRYIIYENALKYLPRSYKLWHLYLLEMASRLDVSNVLDKRFTYLIDAYERAIIHLHKMPRIWLDYCDLLISLLKGTQTRKAFDRALQALPVTQHEKIWELYISWVHDFGVPDTIKRVYRRYLVFDSSHREDYIKYLESIQQYDEAARQLVLCIDDIKYTSSHGTTKYQLWMNLCDICSTHPESVCNILKVDDIIRSGIVKFTDEVGRLWCRLADYYIRLGQFEKARDVYEESMNSVKTVKDFALIFDSYVKVEESIITAKMRMIEQPADAVDEAAVVEDEESNEINADINFGLARLEYLMDRRPLLVNSVQLRQNPHSVNEWYKRIHLYKKDNKKMLQTYIAAIETIDPTIVNGKLSKIYLSFASYYENRHDLYNARDVLRKATLVNYRTVDELATVWCAWGEMEIRNCCYDEALSVMQQAVLEPVLSIKRRKAKAIAEGVGKSIDSIDGAVVADKLYRHIKVWGLYLDLEESLGTIDTVKAAYERCIELKVITTQMILNYAIYLEDNNYYEDSFRAYEKGVDMFVYPQVKVIWYTYLDKFIARHEGTKLERLRDLFEHAVRTVPAADAADLYIKYASVEEKYGLARHCLSIYDRATRIVPDDIRLDLYRLYIKKVEQHYGITRTRPVYERAINELNDDHSRLICIDFAAMEQRLGEIDRARAIFIHGSQFAHPKIHADYWGKWRAFEEEHGNEETFRDMLRIQRSVELANAQFNCAVAAELSTVAGQMNENFVPSSSSNSNSMDAIAKAAYINASSTAAATTNDVSGYKRKFATDSNAANYADDGNDEHTAKRTANSEEINIDM